MNTKASNRGKKIKIIKYKMKSMKENKKSESALEIDKELELLRKKHQEFFDKVGDKRFCDLTMDELKYAVTALLPEIGEHAAKKKR